jgi:hypothetical protein
VNTPVSFEERRKELEELISELHHDMWARGLSVTTDAGSAAADQETLVDGLARKLEDGLQALPPRTSARTLAGILIQVAAARLRTVAFLTARLSATERTSLATLLRLSDEERRTLGTLLRLPGEERSELARFFGLSSLECQTLAAFVADQQAEREKGRVAE